MAGFIVTCETCQTRLRVHDDRATGQIHPCPKCGGMVAIVAPVVAGQVESSEVLPEIASESAGPLWLTPALGLVVGGAVLIAAVGSAAVLLFQGDDEAPAVVEVAAGPAIIQPMSNAPPKDEVSKPPVPESPPIVAKEPSQRESPPKRVAAVPDVPAADTTPVEVEPATKPESVFKPKTFNPLDFDPSELDLTVARGGAEADEFSAGNSDSKNSVSDADRSVPREPAPNVSVELGPTDTGVPAARTLAEQLSLKLESIELPAVPLVDVFNMISDLSATPITVTPATLRSSGIRPKTKVSLEANDITLQEVLKRILDKQQLKLEVRDGQIVIGSAQEGQIVTADYSIDDFLASGFSAAELAKLVERMVDPENWESGGGTARIEPQMAALKFHGTVGTYRELQEFCERLRLARKLPQKGTDPQIALSSYAAFQPTLSKKTTFTLPAWTPLKQVFRFIGEETEQTVLVDWPALADVNLDPQTQVMCSAFDARWEAALDAMLGSLELSWIAVDPETIWITSQAQAAKLESVQFHRVDPAVLAEYSSPKAIIEELQEEFPEARFEYDEPSGYVIARATDAVQRELYRSLTTLKSPQADHEALSQAADLAP